MSREPFPGWSLDPDPLIPDEPAPEPEPRRGGCSVLGWLILIVLLSSWIPGQAVAGEPEPSGAVSERPTIMQIGTLSYVSPRFGPEYLALPYPRGTVATICAVECVTRRSTDYGPDQRVHPNRIADLSAADFVFVCGVPLSAGLCKGTVELEPPVAPDDDRMRAEDAATLPPTDTQ